MTHPIPATAAAQFGDLFRSLVLDPELLFGRVLSTEAVAQAIAEEAGPTGDRLFTPAVTTATFLAQVHSDDHSCRAAVARLKAATDLPIAVGFGVRTPEQAAAIARVADGVVVGSAIVEIVAQHGAHAAEPVRTYIHSLSAAIRAFGSPSSRRGRGSACTVRWRGIGLKVVFANFGSPGVSRRLIRRPSQVKEFSASEIDIPRACSSGSASDRLVPSATLPRRVVTPAS